MKAAGGGVKRWFGRGKARRAAAQRLYLWAVEAARQPAWYLDARVPDTLDGRFDLIVLHLFALQERLRSIPGARKLQRILSETFFHDMDRSLREIGSSDAGLPRRIRAMAEAYLGRLIAYHEAIGDADQWRATLRRNIYADAEDARCDALMQRFAQTQATLRAVPDAAMLEGYLV